MRNCHRSTLLGVLIISLVAAVPVGCNIISPIAYIIGGLPKVDAEYEFEERTTTIFVDDRANVIGPNARGIRLKIADQITQDLIEHDVLKPEMIISPRDTLGLVMAKDRYSDRMPIDVIGREVGAEQILYIEMFAFGQARDGTPKPATACRVRVIDVTNRVRLYPTDSTETSRMVLAELPAIDPSAYRDVSTKLKIYQKLAEVTGSQIGKLFYRHEARELGDRLSYPD